MKGGKYVYKLSPSIAHRFLNCTASLRHELPFEENEYSRRGKFLHEIAGALAMCKPETVGESMSLLSSYEKNLVHSYANTVLTKAAELNAKPIIERKQRIFLYGNAINLIIDALILSREKAIVIDLKTGFSPVETKDNEQLYFYAYFAVSNFPNVNEIEVAIFQNLKYESEILTRGEVLNYFFEKHQIFEDINNDNLKYTPHPKACKYCAIRDTCSARLNSLINKDVSALREAFDETEI